MLTLPQAASEATFLRAGSWRSCMPGRTPGAVYGRRQRKYVPVRRFAMFVTVSLRRGQQWVVFELNDAPGSGAGQCNFGYPVVVPPDTSWRYHNLVLFL